MGEISGVEAIKCYVHVTYTTMTMEVWSPLILLDWDYGGDCWMSATHLATAGQPELRRCQNADGTSLELHLGCVECGGLLKEREEWCGRALLEDSCP